MKKFLVVMSFFLCFFVAIERVEAKSVSWNQSYGGNLNYYYDGIRIGTGGWALGLANPNVTITYGADIISVNGSNDYSDGMSLPIGSRIRVKAKSFANTDISWFGTGYSTDSPFGAWSSNAAPPALAGGNETVYQYRMIFRGTYRWMPFTGGRQNAFCDPSDYVNGYGGWDIYIPLRINPPGRSLSSSGNVSCQPLDAQGEADCVVAAAGAASVSLNISSTYGYFYYRYYDSRGVVGGTYSYTPGCYGNNSIMGPGFVVDVPAQTISFNLTAVSSNNPPTTPTVTPQPFSGHTSTAYPFTFTSTDLDNDQIAYEVDWNNDSLPDESTAFVPSGTSQFLNNSITQWITAGSYSFKVRAKDNQGGYSPWTTPSVTLTTIVNGVCGLASGFSFDTLDITNLALCASGTQTNFLPTGTGWTWGCNGSGGGTSTLPNACTATTKTYTLSAVKNLGPSAAGTIIDTTPTAMSIDSAIPRNTESVPYNSSRTLRANPTSSSISWSGCASVSGNDCIVNNIIADKTVTATFTRLPEPGICGSSNTQSFETLNAGSSGLCSSGAVSGFSLSGTTYSWDCNGSFGSAINVSCSASQIRDYNWKEVRP